MATQKNTKKATPEKKEIKWIQTIKTTIKNETVQFVVGLLCIMVAVYMALAFTSFILNGGADQSAIEQSTTAQTTQTESVQNATGESGAHIAQKLINHGFGVSAYSIAAFLTVLGLTLMRIRKFDLKHWGICCATILIWGSLFLSATIDKWFPSSAIYWGGYHGLNISDWLKGQFGTPGIIIILAVTAIFFSMYISSNTIEFIRSLFHVKLPGKDEQEDIVADTITPQEENTKNIEFSIEEGPTEIEWELNKETEEPINTNELEIEEESYIPESKEEEQIKAPLDKSIAEISEAKGEPEETEFTIQINEEEKADKIIEPYNPRLDLSRYKFPTLDLLNKKNDESLTIDRDEQNANKENIIQALRNFGIEISSIKATVGPTITLYEITPAPGVRISKIKNLEDDIAMTLSALSTRIIAPIPGKGTIGIEIPNANPQIVSMHSVISSRKFQECTYDLPVALGKTITNEIFMFDLCKMPHLLVAGATGQGKSVGLNAIVTSLLYKKHPAELKFVIIDPKKVEFSVYTPIERHFLAKLPDGEDAIITDVTKVVQTLKSICVEMDTRYDLLKMAGVRTVKEYNDKFIKRQLNPEKGHKYMPYIVVIIDEFGDLIMTAGKEVEMPIARIAQLARAVGIHAIIATQRPTTNIITGNIKNNFPARIAFRVTAMIDSRTILDRPGANQLIGRGDLLFLQGLDPVRVQCAFVDTPEVDSICRYISEQQGYPTAFYLPEYVDENASDGSNLEDVDLKRLDPMFEDAARLVVIHQSGSTSLIQRKFSIGYNRAGRIMDQLEKAGIVGPVDGSKPRQVLCSDEMDLEMRLNNLNAM